ncbi:MOSC domain-containing protein [Micromonospora endophytica]|uniref:MOSC domain-containing protein n=1 Tax=Micromonospora endophytica TaxID=515350 RepID=A0A2W2D5U0_9ACTN|nr:MOSC N-terminal beta barrel domain-containing protein [Micromonospora endophytica]PZF99068.1 MOSC domain-containing protein [Micromonospora endophytica]RIW41926.1 MOSC domain-containing protein [Micromonospora endophytica]BCJ58240.1 molybdenum cofactor biosysynthesis protein [Micromonospora endophytica]
MYLSAIHTYPIKGCQGLDHDAAEVAPWGLAADRRWMVVDADGVGITQRETNALVRVHAQPVTGGLLLRAAGQPDLLVPEPAEASPVQVRTFRRRPLRVDALPAGPSADAWLGAVVQRPVRLVWLAQPARHVRRGDKEYDPGDQVSFADAYPVLLTSTTSLAAIFDAGASPVPMARFRPNLVVEGAPAWAEDDWVGRPLRIGGVAFRAAGPSARCLVTTIDQQTGVRDREPLRALARHRNIGRKLLFGLNLLPLESGRVRLGDAIALS